MLKMLAILEQWDLSGYHTDNYSSYCLLLLFKLGLDMVVFFLCSPKKYTYFLSMCSMSITLADSVFTFLMVTTWFLGTERSFVSPCTLLAKASAIYSVLPLPMMCLGLLFYCLDNTHASRCATFLKSLRNICSTLLVWTVAIIFSVSFVNTEPVEMEYETGKHALVCEVQESMVVGTITSLLFIATIFALLPFCSGIFHWMKEADQLQEARQEQTNKSDLFSTSAGTQTTDGRNNGKNYQKEIIWSRPPLWISLTLAFCTFWMPYLVVSVTCQLCGFPVPAYISVNLLWLECTNSLTTGVVFWVRSKTTGPYNNLPENVCLWHIYWHLSKGTQQVIMPLPVFNPLKDKEQTLSLV
ncbi:uncharacterized protein si:dkeyp-100a1.6 [Oryzias melastigma]|uniref:uncharacterized protein si:dkeyp-100a1.6 n=1 Tax=Oryzias melastigma TaxID=30732 RepID=UPI000CF7C8C3|nr:uncharacterized protein si:dkeyp-100a1.6 [Oryzias melastigma]